MSSFLHLEDPNLPSCSPFLQAEILQTLPLRIPVSMSGVCTDQNREVCLTWFLIPTMSRLPHTSREPTCTPSAVLLRKNAYQALPMAPRPPTMMLESFYVSHRG